NASPTDRTPGAGRHAYLSSGNALASARNLLCNESRSSRNRLRISSAVSRFGKSCAAAEAAPATTASNATDAARRTERGAKDTAGTSADRMIMLLYEGGTRDDAVEL